MLKLEISNDDVPHSNQEKSMGHSSKHYISFHEMSVAIDSSLLNQKKPFNLFGLFVLLMAVIGGGSVPAFINMYGDISTFTKNLWRCQINLIASLPLVIFTVYKKNEPIDYEYLTSFKGNFMLFLSGVVFTGACIFLFSVLGLQFPLMH